MVLNLLDLQQVTVEHAMIPKNDVEGIDFNDSLENINKKLIDFYLACNPLRIMADSKLYSKIKSPLILPKTLLSKNLEKKFSKVKLLNFGVWLKNNQQGSKNGPKTNELQKASIR